MFGYKSYTVFGWVIAAVLAVLGLRWGADILFHTETPARLGLAIDLPDESAETAVEAPAAIDLGTLLAAANVEKGAKVAKLCAACHTFDNGGAAAIGPNLWGIPGSAIAARNFKYSAALKEYAGGQAWTWEALDTFLTAPAKAVPGTAMSFAGIRKPTDRADLLAYLNSVSTSPLAFPAPVAPAADGTAVPEPGAAPASDTGAAPGTETAAAGPAVPAPAASGTTPPAAPAAAAPTPTPLPPAQ